MSDSDAASSINVLVLAPMASELRPIVRSLSASRSKAGNEVVYRGRLGGAAITAAMIGVGPRAAAESTRRLLDVVPADHVMVSGIAGGIDPEIQVGSIVTPEVVIDLATGREYRPATLAGVQPWGTIATSEELILDDERLATLIARGVRAVDMETAAVAEVCEDRGCPWSAFRVVSDRPQDGLVDDTLFGMLKSDGTTDGGAALRFVLTHPWRLPRLIHLARDSMAAAKLAADTALRACSAL